MIRQLRRDDWHLLRDVRLRALATDPTAFLDTHEQASTFPDVLWQERATPDERSVSFAVERDGRLDGMIAAFVADDPANVFLVSLWIAPDLRRKGYARGLVESVLGWARDRGAARVCLSVEPQNTGAAKLYERCGFVEPSAPPPFPYHLHDDDRVFVAEL